MRGGALLRLGVIGLGTLVVPLDTMNNVAFPSIIAHFAVPTASVQWLVICYMLAQSSLMLVFGRLGDLVGYRRMFLLGSAWCAGAFVFCVLAPSFGWLLVGRTLQGIGAGLLLSCGPALATQLYPEAMRPRVLGWYTMMFALGGALGPAVAGVLMARWGWVSVFAVRVPMSLLAFACAWSLPVIASQARRERFDPLGALLLSLGIGAALLALAELRAAPLAVPALLMLGGLGCLAFYARRRGAAPPIIDPALFRLPGFAFLNLISVGVNLAGFAVLLLVPFYLERVARMPIIEAGLLLALAPLGTTLAAPLAGRLAERLPARTLMLGGIAVGSLGLFAIAGFGADPHIPLLAAALMLQGLGLGVFQVAYFDVVTATLPLAARGVAGSLGLLTRTVGVVTGASLLVLTFQGLRARGLAHGLAAPEAFLAGYHTAILFAAALPLVLAFGLRRPTPAKEPRT